MSKTEKFKIILSIVCISFIQGLQYCVSPVLGQIQSYYLDVDVSLVQMLITAPAMLSMIVAIASGWIVTKISKKKLLIFSGLVAGVTGFLPFLSDSFQLLFFSRIIYGISLGLATALNTAVVAEFFEGDERVAVMGIQSASIGAGMVVISTVGGYLGMNGFKNTYFINVIGFIAMLLIAICLPETELTKVTKTEKIELNKDVFKVSFLGMLEFLFLITFTTNIAMHLSGTLAGNTTVSGTLTGIFSGSQIIVGLILGNVSRITKGYTLPTAMLSFSVGAILLILFPSNYIALMIGALFCGFSQGVFVPTAMVEVANAVKPVATTMASASLTCTMCVGQIISPVVLNTLAKVTLGEVTTTNVYIISAIGMTAVALITILTTKKVK